MTDKIFKERVTNEMLRNWILPVQPSGKNCAETAFVFFGLITQQECVCSRTNNGKSVNQITKLLRERVKERFEFKRVKLGLDLIGLIKPNYMTMALIHRSNNIGHVVALAVNNNNQLVIIDPQMTGRIWQGDQISDYLKEGKYLYPDGSYNIELAVSKKRINNSINNKSYARISKKRRTNSTKKNTINNLTLQFQRLALGRKRKNSKKKKNQ